LDGTMRVRTLRKEEEKAAWKSRESQRSSRKAEGQ